MTKHCIGFLRSVGRALFLDHAGFGFGLLALILAFDRFAFVSALLASMIGYVYTVRVSTPRILKFYGLIPLNGLFFGLAMATFFLPSPQYFVFLILGAIAVPLMCKATFEVLQHWKLSPYNVPFIISVWIAWLCRSGRALPIRPELPSFDPVFQGAPQAPLAQAAGQVIVSSFSSMSRLMFVEPMSFGMILLALITIFSPRRGWYFLLGTVAGTFTAYLTSPVMVPLAASQYGLYSYSSGLVGLALASSPEKFRWPTLTFFCSFSAVFTLALIPFLSQLGLPCLSAPYVLTLWLAQLSRSPQVNVHWGPLGSPLGSETQSAPSISVLRPIHSNLRRKS